MQTNFLSVVLIVLLATLIATVIFRRLRLPVILGYLLVGAILGHHSLGIVPESHYITLLAEFGIVFLMFTVGLEFSLPKLIALRKIVFGVGCAQVFITILIVTMIGYLFHIPLLSALTIGSLVAMSSTALVIKQLNDQLELHSAAGANAVGILLFQDLAVVPLFILIASAGEGSIKDLIYTLAWAMGKGFLAITIIFLLGRRLFSPLFRIIANTRAIELFTLMVLLVTLFAAWVTNTLGLSYALGAFLAGILLSETEYRHQIEVEIRPFRDILVGLFFVSIGLLTNIPAWLDVIPFILLLILAIVIGKLLIIYVLCYLFGNSSYVSLRTSILLAQAGEFSFALLTLALQKQIISADYGQAILAALLFSIALAPLFLTFNKQIADKLVPNPLRPPKDLGKASQQHLKNHVVLCGYGRVGQHIARLLDKIKYPYIAIDLDPDLVRRAQLAGENVLYGDPTRADILETANLAKAKALVLSFHDIKASENILGTVKHLHPALPVLVRCREESELKILKRYPSAQIIAELFEASLTLSQRLLNIVAIPTNKITEIIHDVRKEDYLLLYKTFTSSMNPGLPTPHEYLHPVIISAGAHAIHKKIKDLNVHLTDVEIVALRRGEIKYFKPHAALTLQENDILILFGDPEKLAAAEEWLNSTTS